MFGFGRRKGKPSDQTIRRIYERADFIYVIGDVHGCLRELTALEALIAEHRRTHAGSSTTVLIGDLIDRGPSSSGVVEHVLGQAGELVVLSGNHEQMFGEFFNAPRPNHPWLQNGGAETLLSYGVDPARLFDNGRRGAQQILQSYLPREHMDFLSSLPLCAAWPDLVCVHAGLAAGVDLERQSPNDMTWLRLPQPAYTRPQPFGLLVHGHTPAAKPVVEPHRVCVDTGAFATGILTAAVIDRQMNIQFLQTRPVAR